MAMKFESKKEGLSLPGFIDIIFLLLIFSLVTYSFTSSTIEGEDTTGLDDKLNLPLARLEVTSESDKILHTLMFQIERTIPNDPASSIIVYALRPLVEEERTVQQAKEKAMLDSTFAVFNVNFLEQSNRAFRNSPACRLIRSEIEQFKQDHFRRPRPTNAIAIRAVEDTEFRIINYIMDRCSTYGDTIPKLDLLTLTGR